jgi:hypothetical protein
MVAQRDAEDLLRLFLFDDVAVEVRLDVARPAVEGEQIAVVRRVAVAGGSASGLGWRRSALEMLAHELGQLPLKLLGCRRPVEDPRFVGIAVSTHNI